MVDVEFDEDGFLKCPFCPCMFCTREDLDLHLARFGSNVVLHEREFRRVHREAERNVGGVDRVVRDFERIILDYGSKRMYKRG